MGRNRRKPNKQRDASTRSSKRDQQDHLQKLTMYTGIGVVVVVLALVGGYLITQQGGMATDGGDTASFEDANVPLSTEGQPMLGASDAPVKVIEFGDFKCPACKAFHERVFPQLQSRYIDPGHIRFSFINFPFLADDSWTAAVASECVYERAGNDAFWDYYDAIYANQGPESQTWATPEFLVQLAVDYVDAEIAPDGLRQCITEGRYRDAAERDRAMGTTANIPGTPTIFVNGQQLENFGFDTIASAIDNALNKSSE